MCYITPKNWYGNDSSYQNTVILFDSGWSFFLSFVYAEELWSDSINSQRLYKRHMIIINVFKTQWRKKKGPRRKNRNASHLKRKNTFITLINRYNMDILFTHLLVILRSKCKHWRENIFNQSRWLHAAHHLGPMVGKS